MDRLLYIFDLFGTSIFAITGALAAGRKRMDIFGVMVLACTTALGGGTLRDIMLGVYPIFWIEFKLYFVISIVSATATFVLARFISLPTRILVDLDTIGLSIFTLVGFEKGNSISGSYLIGIIMGAVTGTFGGIIRDVLADEVPLILKREIYASASLGGASLFALLSFYSFPRLFSFFVCMIFILTIRALALHYNVSLPLFLFSRPKSSKKGKKPPKKR